VSGGLAADVTYADARWGPRRLVTTPLSWLYGAAARARAWTFDAGWAKVEALSAPTIAIGNLAVGGTGKSPVTMRIAAWLQQQGERPAILARGYGGGLPASASIALLDGVVVMPPEGVDAAGRQGGAKWRAPDEAMMQSRALAGVPVVCGARRLEAARRLEREHRALAPTVWLLDDGYQHRRVARDVNLVLVDATAPLGNGRLLPRGPLREAPAALARATAIVCTRAAGGAVPTATYEALRPFAPSAPIVGAAFRTELPETSVDGATSRATIDGAGVLVACGIAGPEAFVAALRAGGVRVADVLAVADHAPLTRSAIEARLAAAAGRIAAVVTTAKDWWRDPTVLTGLSRPVFCARLTVELADEIVAELVAGALARG
jgi:tetraacyldisaccharide 4'-kinase